MAKYASILAAFLTVLVGRVAPVDESAWTNQAQEGVKKMALVPVGPAPGGPFATILCPDDGNPATAEDIRRPVAALLRNYELVDGNKVDRAGDTMTGTLNINPSAPNTQGLYVLGNGTMPAIYALGGATGKGIVVEASPNQQAVFITGNGTAYATRIVAGSANGALTIQSNSAEATLEVYNASSGPGTTIIGSTSAVVPALSVATTTPQNATTPRMSTLLNGFLAMAGTDPNREIDPGADNALHGANIPKAWGRVASRAGDTDATRPKSGYNFDSVITTIGTCEIVFAREIDTEYSVTLTIMGGAPFAVFRTDAETSTGFTIVGQYLAAPNLPVQIQTAGQFDIGWQVHGRQ